MYLIIVAQFNFYVNTSANDTALNIFNLYIDISPHRFYNIFVIYT